MARKLAWCGLILLTALPVWVLYETDTNYLEFIKGTGQIQIVIHQGELELSPDAAVIDFIAQITNPSPLEMWVEAMNYHVSINGQPAGYSYMPEARPGELAVPPGETRKIALQVKLQADYLKLFLQSWEGGEGKGEGEVVVNISGRARVGFDIGRSGMKAFYPFGGIIWSGGAAATAPAPAPQFQQEREERGSDGES